MLNVPLTVRLGDRHITRHVQGLSFRKEAVGGLRNITFRLARPITSLDADLAPFAKVYVYDARSAETIAEARLSDSGRSAGDGQGWEVAAFGPVQAASDVTVPLIYVDRDLAAWREIEKSSGEASFVSGTQPGSTSGTQGLLGQYPQDTVMNTNDYVSMRYERIQHGGMKLGGFGYSRTMGVTSASFFLECVVTAAGASPANATSNAFSTVAGTSAADVVTNFPNGHDRIDLRYLYVGPGGFPPGPGVWAFASNMVVRMLVHNKNGSEVTGGYAGNLFTYASSVVEDLLGRPGLLDDFDGANATVENAANVQINQLAYPDGATPAQVLEDLMQFEPAYRWYSGPDTTGGGYEFRWELWPTAVRYEVTLDDGGSFPLSGQTLYNKVGVRWRNAGGAEIWTFRTRACKALDDQGLMRQTTIDLGSEAGTLDQAIAAGDAFLEQHNVPVNSGSLTIARPIRDVITGRMVDPWEIEAGELVRVRGVESYADALNADSNDGQTVFRIFAVDYTSESNSAQLELDADPHTIVAALKKLLNARSRR